MGLIEKVYAADTVIPPIVLNPGTGGIAELVGNVVTIVLYVASVLAFFYLIYSGILYITAAGNPDAAKKGQQGIINAIIGIIIIALALVILNAVIGVGKTGSVVS